jgi:hypothetical protein
MPLALPILAISGAISAGVGVAQAVSARKKRKDAQGKYDRQVKESQDALLAQEDLRKKRKAFSESLFGTSGGAAGQEVQNIFAN